MNDQQRRRRQEWEWQLERIELEHQLRMRKIYREYCWRRIAVFIVAFLVILARLWTGK